MSAGSGLTALKRDPEHAVSFVTRYADRLLFGRDFYEQDLHNFLQTLPLSQEVIEKIYWQNAERLVAPPATSSAPSLTARKGSGKSHRIGQHRQFTPVKYSFCAMRILLTSLSKGRTGLFGIFIKCDSDTV